MKLIVVRHGEARFNVEQRYLGALNPELTSTGIEQAKNLRGLLPSDITAVISSPLIRARQTAEIICQDTNLKPVLIDAFRERNVGVFEGLAQMEARIKYPHLRSKNITRIWNQAPDGGETIQEVVERVSAGLNELIETYPQETILVVAHGFVGKVVRAICNSDFDDFYEWNLKNGEFFEADLLK